MFVYGVIIYLFVVDVKGIPNHLLLLFSFYSLFVSYYSEKTKFTAMITIRSFARIEKVNK